MVSPTASIPRPWALHYDAGVPKSLAPYPDRTLVDYLDEAAERYPDRAALLFKGRALTYGELGSLSDAFAMHLAGLGVKKGDRVALCLPNCPQFSIAEFGAWTIGAVVCPFNPTYTDREMEDALVATDAETLVVLNRLYEKLKGVQPRTSLKRIIATGIKDFLPGHLRILYGLLKEKKDGERITLRDGDVRLTSLLDARASKNGAGTSAGAVRPNVDIKPSDVSSILMSGGTTGTPKGVVGNHAGIVKSGLQLAAWLKPSMNEWTDVIMLPLPLFHTYGFTGVQSLAMVNHNPIALIPNPRDLPDLLKAINKVKPAFICAVPTLLNGVMTHPLARAGKIDFKSIKLCFCGAAALMAETTKRWQQLTGGVILEGYSLTEAQMAVVANPAKGPKKVGSVGMPLPDVDIRIVDSEDGRTPVKQGDVGEIVIVAPQLMIGYWKRERETAEMLRTNADGERMLFTGDLGYLDEDGYLFIVDRKKDLIKTSGFQVWPREIEEVIAANPAVAEVGVAGLPDQMKGETVKAWVVLRPGMQSTPEALRAFCKQQLAPYKVPSQIEIVKDLPKSQVGKVLRRVLRDGEAAKVPAAR
jgi:long-chain acyl-CoA synthetase